MKLPNQWIWITIRLKLFHLTRALASRISYKWQTGWSDKKCYCVSTKYSGTRRKGSQFFLTFPRQNTTCSEPSAAHYLYPVWMNPFFVWLFKANVSVSTEAPTGSLKTTYSVLVNVSNDVPEHILVCPVEMQDFHRSSMNLLPNACSDRKKRKKEKSCWHERKNQVSCLNSDRYWKIWVTSNLGLL